MQTGTIAFLLGVVLMQFQPELPDSPWWLLAYIIPLMLYRRYRPLAMPLMALLTGLAWATYCAQIRLNDELAPSLEGEDVQLVGEVSSLPERDRRRTRFLFEVKQLSYRGAIYRSPSLVRLSWYDTAPSIEPGQHWQLTVRLKRPHGMLNPGGFDYERWLFTQGIRATGYVRNGGEHRLLGASHFSAPVQQLRHGLQQRLQRTLRGSSHGGIVQALAIGERGGISDSEWALLLATGTNHLMAISGLHVGLVAGLVYWLCLHLWRLSTKCCIWLAAPRAAALAATLAAMGYAALAGFSVPTQRALVMLALVMTAILWMRLLLPSRWLALAMLALLLHDPLVVLASGFWLSFAAVAIILYGMTGRLSPGGAWWRWGRVQWLVAIGLTPLLLLLFGRASGGAPLANLVAVPWVGFLVVPLSLLGTLLLGVWETAGVLLLQLAAWLLELLWPVLELLADTIPGLQRAEAPWWTYAIAMPGLIWLLAPRGWPVRSAGMTLLLPLLFWQPAPLAHGEVRFTLLDVGQGLAAVVETRHHLLLFDTGPRYRSGFNTGDAVVLPFLQRRGDDRIDTLIVSHGDIDHIGGAQALAQEVQIERVLTSVPHKMDWIPHERCRRGQHWQWDGVLFEVLHPSGFEPGQRGNNRSCVVRVSVAGESLLLTGDIEQQAEAELVQQWGVHLHADVMVAPHHGSKTSSSERFLAAVSPEWVLLPLGYRNRYGFPHPQVVERYRKYRIASLTSSESGAISLVLGRGRIEPTAYRNTARRYWHDGE